MRSRSVVRSVKSSCELLKSRSFSSVTSRCTSLTRSSSVVWMFDSSASFSSRLVSMLISFSNLFWTASSFRCTASRRLVLASRSAEREELVTLATARSFAALLSVFLSTSTSSLVCVSVSLSCMYVRRSFATPRSAIAMLASSSLLLVTSCSKKRARSSSCACFSRRSTFMRAKRSVAARMAASRRFIASTASSHCSTSCVRSLCSVRKSSAVLSS
mmetsp:Transcript_25911/g.88672  ORF Transcript_25911/g.88672 Transcript_25911/m.88672 type:complete len:216 (+) Transcript_25911:3190-3837(+)